MDLGAAIAQASQYGLIWSRGLAFDVQAGEFNLAEAPALTQYESGVTQRCRGVFIQNDSASGYASALGQKIIQSSDKALVQLASLIQSKEWRALQVDLESLAEASAADYERFLDRLAAALAGKGVGDPVLYIRAGGASWGRAADRGVGLSPSNELSTRL